MARIVLISDVEARDDASALVVGLSEPQYETEDQPNPVRLLERCAR